MFHIARTLWGLAQLQAYKSWCSRALVCIYRMGYANRAKDAHFQHYEDWRHQIMHFYKVSLKRTSAPSDVATSADTEVLANMLVNSSLIDNELVGLELPVRFAYPRCGIVAGVSNLMRGHTEDWICSSSLVQCTIRWTLSFLSQFGRQWIDAYASCENISDSLRKTGVHVVKKGRKVPSYFELLGDVPFGQIEIRENALPYASDVLRDFEKVLGAHRETLANQLKFYNGGVLDNLDYLLSAELCEAGKKESKNKRIDSISKITTAHLTAFLKLMTIIDRAEDECHYEEASRRASKVYGGKRISKARASIESQNKDCASGLIQKCESAVEGANLIIGSDHAMGTNHPAESCLAKQSECDVAALKLQGSSV
eukprot:IDg6120t1